MKEMLDNMSTRTKLLALAGILVGGAITWSAIDDHRKNCGQPTLAQTAGAAAQTVADAVGEAVSETATIIDGGAA